LSGHEEQGLVWDYFKPRHTHTWNMLVLSWLALEQFDEDDENPIPFGSEYLWENFIIRLWLYRTTVKTLVKIAAVKDVAKTIVETFDGSFVSNGRNGLKALRDMLEHFDDYATGDGRGPAERSPDLDPWRTITKDRYERGAFHLDRDISYDAAIKMRADANAVSDKFIEWYKSQKTNDPTD
jgi:hypothetical protein